MRVDSAYDRLVGMIYDAAIDFSHWNQVIEELCSQFGVRYGSIFTPFSSAIGLEPIWYTNAEPHLIAQMARMIPVNDILIDAIWRQLPKEFMTYSVGDLVPRSVYEAWPTYQELYRPNGVEELVGVVVNGEDHRACTVNLYFPEIGAGEIADVKEFLQRVGVHFARSARIAWHVSTARQNADSAQATLNLFQTGVAWLNSTGQRLFSNEEFDRLAALKDGIDIAADGHLEVRCKSKLLNGLREAENGRETVFLIQRSSGRAPFRVRIVPLPLRAEALRLPDASAICFVAEETPPLKERIERASRLFGLTTAEARVLVGLMRGLDADEIANESGTKLNTVRTQLKAILGKCDVSRQADLIRKVAFLP